MKTVEELLAFLDEHQITFQRWDHTAVFTVEQVNDLAIDMPGIHTKNLFLRDKRATRLFMLVVPGDKTVDLKTVERLVGVNHLSFASADRLQSNLGIGAGSVSVLALVNDEASKVEVVFDREVWQAEAITAHPLVNTATLVISKEGLERFLEITRHSPLVVDL
jgi:Ala-tRNA(Pro) deacylase